MATRNAAVLSEYSKLKFITSKDSPSVPASVIEQRGGHTGNAVNKHSRLRFNIKVPRKGKQMAVNFPPRPAPVIIEKMQNSIPHQKQRVPTIRFGPTETFQSHDDSVSSQGSLQSKADMLLSDRLALATWLAKRDLERNRAFALTMLAKQSGTSEPHSELDSGSGDDSLDKFDSSIVEPNQLEESFPDPSSTRLTRKRNLVTDPSVKYRTSTVQKKLQFRDLSPGVAHPKTLRKHPHRELPKEESLVRRTNYEEADRNRQNLDLLMSFKQMLGQLSALEGVLKRSHSNRICDLDELELRREGVRGEEQVARNGRLMYNLKQQVQDLCKELDRFHTAALGHGQQRKKQLTQHLQAACRSSLRVMQSLLRMASLLRPHLGDVYYKQFTHYWEFLGVLQQLTCATMELDLGDEKMINDLNTKQKYFEDLITNLSMKEEHSFSTTVDKRNKSTGYKKRSSKAKKPVTARSRGVILPGHLKKKADVHRKGQVLAGDLSTNKTVSSWLKKQFQSMKDQQEDRPNQTSPRRFKPEHGTPIQRHTHPSHGVPQSVAETQSSKKCNPNRNISSSKDKLVQENASPISEDQPSQGAIPLGSPAWRIMSKEIARQVWLDKELLRQVEDGKRKSSREHPASPGSSRPLQGKEEKPASQGVQVSAGTTLHDSNGLSKVNVEDKKSVQNTAALEAILNRLKELEEEDLRILQRWSTISYVDSYIPTEGGIEEEHTRSEGQSRGNIFIEPVNVVGDSGLLVPQQTEQPHEEYVTKSNERMGEQNHSESASPVADSTFKDKSTLETDSVKNNTECSGSSDVRHLLKDFGEDDLWNVCDELVDNLISEEFAQPDSSIRSTSTLTSSSHFN